MTNPIPEMWIFYFGAATLLTIIVGALTVLFRSKSLFCSVIFLASSTFWTWATLMIRPDQPSQFSFYQSVVNYLYWASPSVSMALAGQAILWWLESPRNDRYIKLLVWLNLFISFLSLTNMFNLDFKQRAYIVFFIQPMVQLTLVWLACLRAGQINNIKSEVFIYAVPVAYFCFWYGSDFLLRPNDLTAIHTIYSPLAALACLVALVIAVIKIKMGTGSNAIRFNGYEKKWDHLTLLPISGEFIRQLEKRFAKRTANEGQIIVCSVKLDEVVMRQTLKLNSLDIDEIYVSVVNRIQDFNKFSDIVGRYTNDTFIAVFSVTDTKTFMPLFVDKVKAPFNINALMGASETVTLPIQIRCVDMSKRKFKIDSVLYELHHGACVA